jgi:hypothetical protein
MRAGGISAEAARQRLSRLPANVRVLYGIPFPKRARFIYLDDQFGSSAYWDALQRDIDEAGPAYAAALAGVRARGGIVPGRISMSPPARQSFKSGRSPAPRFLSD